MTEQAGEEVARTPRQRWGTCCPFDPECDHSYIDGDALARWMDSPLTNEQAAGVAGPLDWCAIDKCPPTICNGPHVSHHCPNGDLVVSRYDDVTPCPFCGAVSGGSGEPT